MNQFSIKISSILTAFLVLFSTFSFTVKKHYCGDFLTDISYIGEADGCDMKIDEVSSTKKNCCKDEVHQIKGQDELKQVSVDDFDFQKQQFLVAFIFSYNNLFLEVGSQNNIYKDFFPPDIPFDYRVSYQTFLI